MASHWRYIRAGQEYGPVTSGQLKALADAGRLLRTDAVWREGLSEWVPAGQVKGLFPDRGTLTPPAGLVRPGAPPRAGMPGWSPAAAPAAGAFAVSDGAPTGVRTANPTVPACVAGPAHAAAAAMTIATFSSGQRAARAGLTGLGSAPAAVPDAARAGRSTYRVVRGGQVSGPHTADEVRQLFATGQLAPGDLIGIESWVPAAALADLFAPAALPPAGSGAAAVAAGGGRSPVNAPAEGAGAATPPERSSVTPGAAGVARAGAVVGAAANALSSDGRDVSSGGPRVAAAAAAPASGAARAEVDAVDAVDARGAGRPVPAGFDAAPAGRQDTFEFDRDGTVDHVGPDASGDGRIEIVDVNLEDDDGDVGAIGIDPADADDAEAWPADAVDPDATAGR